jgi:hypothetical protein
MKQMKVFTLVQIIERDCDVNVWTFKSLDEAINLKMNWLLTLAEHMEYRM